MNNDIKEILDRLDFNEWEVDLYKVPITWCELYNIRDYITNLQTIEQQYSVILSENAELENKITNLQEENKELNNQNKNLKEVIINSYQEALEEVLDKLKELKEGVKDE